MAAADRKNEDRQLANALTASGYKTRKEKLRERLLTWIKRYPKSLSTACAGFLLDVQKARDFDDLWVLFSDNAMEDLLVWARQIQEEENAKLRPKIVSSRRDADGAGHRKGASPVSQNPSAGPVRGSAALTADDRREAIVSFAATVRKSLYDTTVIDGKPLGDWTREEVFSTLRPRCAVFKFALTVAEQSVAKGPLRTSNISEERLAEMLMLSKASVGD